MTFPETKEEKEGPGEQGDRACQQCHIADAGEQHRGTTFLGPWKGQRGALKNRAANLETAETWTLSFWLTKRTSRTFSPTISLVGSPVFLSYQEWERGGADIYTDLKLRLGTFLS
jgi:hypothetical protein